ncbi:Kinesin-like protein kip2 [Rhodotorula mucilaginosa]|uniref:Kinesin-like protein n=1 Tax=Rhodotorula mucilaginosa TaxID=5537 RepID=A0A9P6W1C0_RHOMI|nr:Kinesin-like protein kip2 [Rhodotorula mucilaginosa]
MAPAVTQHRPAFTPVLKHKPGEPADSPGYSSPSWSQAGTEGSRARAGPSSSGSSAVMLQPASPLTARSLENVPYYDPKPRATPKTVLSELPRSTDEEDRAAWSAAPRIRAKLTPAATPRRKAADVHGSHRAHVGAASPASATAHKPSFAVAPATPQAASLVLPPPPSSPSRRTQPTSDPESVAVCVRVRPPTDATTEESTSPWQIDEELGGHGLAEYGSLSPCREELGLVSMDAMEGFDAVVFAYGQTASGKTFTLAGDSVNPGLIPLSVSEIFQYIQEITQHAEREFLLRISYMEIYNETLRDLLNPATVVRIRQDKSKRFFASPLQEEVVTTEAQVWALIARGAAARQVGETDYNARSSRSHSVFQVTIESRDDAVHGSGVVRTSRLSLIDLAGSESATSQASRRAEGAFINKSLLTLEKVIASLTSDAKQLPHVPFRDSKLTQILQPSLSGDARVVVIATINPSTAMVEETKSTLRFAQRVKKVVLKAARHEVVNDKALISQYRSHIAALEAQLAATAIRPERAPGQLTPVEQVDVLVDSNRVLQLERQVEEFRSLFLTSKNLESRRRISPTKIAPFDDDGSDTQDRFAAAQDEIDALTLERDALRSRVEQLERERVSCGSTESQAGEAELRQQLMALAKENHELHVVLRNSDAEGALLRQEKKFSRQLDKCRVYARSLENLLEEERKRVAQFEHFILQTLSTQASLLTASATADGGLDAEASLTAAAPAFIELEHLPFSQAGRDTLRRSSTRVGRSD